MQPQNNHNFVLIYRAYFAQAECFNFDENYTFNTTSRYMVLFHFGQCLKFRLNSGDCKGGVTVTYVLKRRGGVEYGMQAFLFVCVNKRAGLMIKAN